MLETHNQAEPISRDLGRKGAYGRACGRGFVKTRWYPGRKCKVGIDGNGNLLKKGDTTYTWDARDRLVSTNGAAGAYGYDTSNLRTNMGEQKVLLDGIEEAREYGASEVRYDHNPSQVDGLLAQKAGGVKGYFVTDALGSVYAVVDASGAVVSKYGYDVYGARTATTEGMATGWGFTGRRYDSSTEMYYRARYLDGTAGIFMQNDPAGMVDGPNKYIYVIQRPTMFIDPNGLALAHNTVVARIATFIGTMATQGLRSERGKDALMELEILMGNAAYGGAELTRRAGLPIQRAVTEAFQATVNTSVRNFNRIPDLVNSASTGLRAIGEIKSGELCNLRWDDQIRIFANWANATGGQFFLFINGSASALQAANPTVYSRALQANVIIMDIHTAIRAGFMFPH